MLSTYEIGNTYNAVRAIVSHSCRNRVEVRFPAGDTFAMDTANERGLNPEPSKNLKGYLFGYRFWCNSKTARAFVAFCE